MNENEVERYEAELRGNSPAPLPEDFMARLRVARPVPTSAVRVVTKPAWPGVWRWAAPALAAAVAGLLVVQAHQPGRAKEGPLALVTDNLPRRDRARTGGLKADYVEVDHELVSSFDLVATLPSGEPVRFRCRQWRDQLVVTDRTNGVEIEQDIPRVEVVPVRFETY